MSHPRPLLLLAALLAPHVAPGAERRPNILFSFADDWGRHAGAYARVDGPGSSLGTDPQHRSPEQIRA